MTLFGGSIDTAPRYLWFWRELFDGNFRDPHRALLRRRLVRRSHHPMRDERIVKAGERHIAPGIERIEKCLELRLIRMVADVAAIEHLHRQLAPLIPIQPGERLRMKLVDENAPFAADQMCVKVVRL